MGRRIVSAVIRWTELLGLPELAEGVLSSPALRWRLPELQHIIAVAVESGWWGRLSVQAGPRLDSIVDGVRYSLFAAVESIAIAGVLGFFYLCCGCTF